MLSRNLLNGYQKERQLRNDEIEILKQSLSIIWVIFLFHHSLIVFLIDWKVSDEKVLVTPKNPNEFIKILDFHKEINDPGEYGV